MMKELQDKLTKQNQEFYEAVQLKGMGEKYKTLERRVKDFCLENLPSFPSLAPMHFNQFFPGEKCPDYDSIFKLKYPKEYQEHQKKQQAKK